MRILLCTTGRQSHSQMQLEVFRRLADKDAVREHALADDASRADAFLFVDLHQHPDDPLLRSFRRHPLVRSHPDKIYVYDERDLPFFTFPGIYVGASPAIARRLPVVGGPYPSVPNPVLPQDAAPDLLFSFQGGRTHPVRARVLDIQHERGLVEDTSRVRFIAGRTAADDEAVAAQSRYADIVTRSKFVLCPRGHGASSFRLYEVMAAGRVPVVISDDWLPPPRIPWDRCVVRIAERDAHRIPQMLEEREHRWPDMASAARSAYESDLADDRLWHHYVTSISQLRHAASGHSPWWAQREILRFSARRLRHAAGRFRPSG